MNRFWRAISFSMVVLGGCLLFAQDLAPRAYIVTPIHSNAVTLTTSFFDGEVLLDGSVPITGAKARFDVAAVSLFHSLHFFGRSASFLATMPYGVGNFNGHIQGIPSSAYRSGLVNSEYRFSVNLYGGPAMDVNRFRNWRQKTLIGASLKIVAPTGQYDPARLLNLGSNRWAFKPEVGLSRRWGHWVCDGYGAVWFFTTNSEFFSRNQYYPGVRDQSQSPVGAFEGHLSYDVKPRLWASFDANFWTGGTTSINGVENSSTRQQNSRVGGTFSFPVSKHQSFKVSYNKGAYIRFGGNYQNVSVGWQYSWLGRPN